MIPGPAAGVSLGNIWNANSGAFTPDLLNQKLCGWVKRKMTAAVAFVAQWIECWPANQRQPHIDVSLPLSFPSLL